MSIRIRSFALTAALLLVALAHQAGAQTPDQLAYSLGASSPVVVTGRVTAIQGRWDAAADAIYTYITVSVTEQLKGELAESTIVIKQLGGQLGTVGLRVADQASYTVGENVLVFLAVRPRDGTLYPAGFQLGKWQLSTSDGQTLAVPSTSSGSSLAGPATAEAQGIDLATIRSIVDATPALQGDFVTRPAESSLAGPAFAFLPTGGNPARWHQVDDDVDVLVNSQTPPGGVAGQTQLNNALGLWSVGGSTRLTLRFDGSGPVPPTCSGFNAALDRRILVLYNDPCNEISDADPNVFGVGGGFFTAGDRRTINGTEFDAFVQGVAVLNNVGPHTGSAGCFQDALTHVLGHTVGLGDTDSVGARMRPTLAGDCSAGGHGLGADDVSGLQSIYPAVASGGAPPHAPTALTYTESLGTVTLTWTPATTGGPATSYVIDAGTAPGLTNITTLTVSGSTTSLVATGVPQGVYYLRVRARNVLGTSGPSPERAVIVGPCMAPNTPSALNANVVDQFVTLGWAPPAGGTTVQGYTLAVGSAPGLSNILVLPYPASTLGVSGVAGFGDYYVRVAAINACGASAPTTDLLVRVQPCVAPPNAPTNLTFVRNGNQVNFAWAAPASGPPPAQYVIVAGSVPGAIDLAVYPTGNQLTSLSAVGPPGTYYVRVLAINACGNSGFTNEVQVVIP